MKAKDAKELKIGDWVLAHFSHWMRGAKIIDIQWPKFLLQRIDSEGRLVERWRTYRSLYGRAESGTNNLRETPTQDWLTWPNEKGDDNQAPQDAPGRDATETPLSTLDNEPPQAERDAAV